jgi:hypothetical protein
MILTSTLLLPILPFHTPVICWAWALKIVEKMNKNAIIKTLQQFR